MYQKERVGHGLEMNRHSVNNNRRLEIVWFAGTSHHGALICILWRRATAGFDQKVTGTAHFSNARIRI